MGKNKQRLQQYCQSLLQSVRKEVWTKRDSNPRPSACKADALNQLRYSSDCECKGTTFFLTCKRFFKKNEKKDKNISAIYHFTRVPRLMFRSAIQPTYACRSSRIMVRLLALYLKNECLTPILHAERMNLMSIWRSCVNDCLL